MATGRLYVVATPIGNLDDVTARALEVLSTVRLIAAEDTRHTRVLLDRYGITTPLASLPAFAEGQRATAIVERLRGGDDVAVVTDAGTPGISDPGQALVEEAIAEGVPIVPVPGPSAVIAALSASGLPSGRFHFLGFLPRHDREARTMVEEVRSLSATLVLYESPRRLPATLALLLEVLGDRKGCVARELTKKFEELRRGPLSALADHYRGPDVLGEVVVVVEGLVGGPPRWTEAEVRAALAEGLAAGERLKPLTVSLAAASGWSASELYRLGLQRGQGTS